jgi:hypothetical protein
MSFLYGTQVECIYAMPAKGAAATAAASTVLTQVNAGTAAGGGAYQLPAGYFQAPSTGGPGRSLLIKGGGYWSIGATSETMLLTVNLDTTAGTALTGGLLASTGAITPQGISTSGLFDFEVMVTCTAAGVSAGVLQTIGTARFGQVPTINGQVQTLGTFGTTTSVNTFLIGGVNAGLSSFNTQQSYFVEAFNTWSGTTNAPSMTLTNFYVFGLN